jgi:hypothetical protein
VGTATAWQYAAHTVLTGLLDQSALYGVLAEIEALGRDVLEIRKLSGTTAGYLSGAQMAQCPSVANRHGWM